MSSNFIQLTDDLDQPLDSLAKRLGVRKNDLVNQAIREFLTRQSLEESRWQDTLEALESVKSGDWVDENDVRVWLKSWGDKRG